MKLSLMAAFLLAAGSGIVAAQSAQTGETITVAGCLQRAQRTGSVGGTVVGTSASPNTADDEANSSVMVDAFLLAEATPVVSGGTTTGTTSGSSSGSVGATGTSGRVDPTTFGLQGHEAELETHQGARLEVTGSIMPPASSGRGTGGAATASGAKRLKVASFKILAEKCGAQ